MSYSTISDLINQFGEIEVVAITDRNRDGVIDEPVANSALQRASDMMDSYLVARYPLPLSVVPHQLVDLCCDIARYKLLGSDVTETDPARYRYKDALRTLEHIRDGKIDIGLSVAGLSPAESVSVKTIGGGRKFDRVSLSDY